jgi:hypothetical protein
MRLLAIALVLCTAAPSYAADLDWLKGFAGKTTNALAWEPRFKPDVLGALPVKPFKMLSRTAQPLPAIALELVGGSPDLVRVSGGRFVVASACRHHSCIEKGLVWVDTKQGRIGFAALHYVWDGEVSKLASLFIASNGTFGADTMPQEFRDAVSGWLNTKQVRFGLVRFLEPSGTIEPRSQNVFDVEPGYPRGDVH